MKITYANCPRCGRLVELNGPGSTATIWQRGLTWTLNRLYPMTQRILRPASDEHDMDYHMGPQPGEDRFKARERDDERFHRNANREVRKSGKSFLVKTWLYYQTEKYHAALRIGGGDVYPYASCTDPSRKEDLDARHKENSRRKAEADQDALEK